MVWETDNNGQLSRSPDTDAKLIGKCTTAKETDKGDVRKLAKYCQKNLFIANAIILQKGHENLYTWADGNGESDRQIDYIAVSNGNRNMGTNAQTKAALTLIARYDEKLSKSTLNTK